MTVADGAMNLDARGTRAMEPRSLKLRARGTQPREPVAAASGHEGPGWARVPGDGFPCHHRLRSVAGFFEVEEKCGVMPLGADGAGGFGECYPMKKPRGPRVAGRGAGRRQAPRACAQGGGGRGECVTLQYANVVGAAHHSRRMQTGENGRRVSRVESATGCGTRRLSSPGVGDGRRGVGLLRRRPARAWRLWTVAARFGARFAGARTGGCGLAGIRTACLGAGCAKKPNEASRPMLTSWDRRMGCPGAKRR